MAALGHAVRGRSDRSNLGSVGTRRHLRCTHSMYIFNQVCIGFSNEVRLHWFPSPPFVSPFHSFPFTHLFLFFLFVSSLASCPFISLLSFFCAHNGLGLSLYAHIYLHTQVLGRPGLDNEVGFIGCPCALGFSFIATTHTFVSVSSSFSCLHPFVLEARTFALSS